MVLKGLCLARKGAGAFTMAWGPPARLLLAWTALLCMVGVQGRWDRALESAGPGRVRRRGSPGVLQGCVRAGRRTGPGGWAGLGRAAGWGEQGPGNVPQGRGSPAVPCSPKGPMCAAPVSMPTAAPAGGRCQAGTSASFVSATATWRGGAQAGDAGAALRPAGKPSPASR